MSCYEGTGNLITTVLTNRIKRKKTVSEFQHELLGARRRSNQMHKWIKSTVKTQRKYGK